MIINNENNVEDVDDGKDMHSTHEEGSKNNNKKKNRCLAQVLKNYLITLYSFIKVVSIFIYYSQIVARLRTMGIKVDGKFIENDSLHK